MKIILNVSKGKAFALLNVILTLALISVIFLGMFKIISGNTRRNKIIREELSIYSTNFEEDLLTKVNICLKEDDSLCSILINEDKEITINENCRLDYNKAKNKIEIIYLADEISYRKLYRYKVKDDKLVLLNKIER